jgi:hypothetical protein
MNLFAQRWLVPAVFLAWALAVPAWAAAPGSGSSDDKKTESPAEKVRKALDQTIDLDVNTPGIEPAVNELAMQAKINVVLDRFTIQQMGIDPMNGSPVQVKLQGVKVRTGLRAILGQYNLSYAVIGEAVVITTEDMAIYRQMRQRVSVDLDKVLLEKALKQLSKETATNLMVDSRVAKEAQTPVSLQLEDVPLETAVRLMAESAGLKAVRVGNVLFVTNKANANEMKSDNDLIPHPQPGAAPTAGMNADAPVIRQMLLQNGQLQTFTLPLSK